MEWIEAPNTSHYVVIFLHQQIVAIITFRTIENVNLNVINKKLTIVYKTRIGATNQNLNMPTMKYLIDRMQEDDVMLKLQLVSFRQTVSLAEYRFYQDANTDRLVPANIGLERDNDALITLIGYPTT